MSISIFPKRIYVITNVRYIGYAHIFVILIDWSALKTNLNEHGFELLHFRGTRDRKCLRLTHA